MNTIQLFIIALSIYSPIKTTNYNDVISIKSEPTACTFSIGQTYQGGKIFYLDCSGCHGLIASPTDISTAPWFNGSYTNTSAFASAVGAGLLNSKLAVLNQGTGTYATKLCTDLNQGGYTDWYLPSKHELNLMYMNIGQGAAAPNNNIGQFSNGNYWSSTEINANEAWYQLFLLGGQTAGNKNNSYAVRAIRSF